MDEMISCPRCDGDPGAILDGGHPCFMCNGTGKVRGKDFTFHPDYREPERDKEE